MNQKTKDFNKQIVLSEIGGAFFGPLFGFMSSYLHYNNEFISSFTVLGSVIGAAMVWLFIRIGDEKRRKEHSLKKLALDITTFSPVAFTVALIFAYPIIFFVTRHLLVLGVHQILSSLVGTISGAVIYLIIINIYRHILHKKFGREL